MADPLYTDLTGDDEYYMGMALKLAQESRFKTAPNPCVGAVLTRDGLILGKGKHECYGAAHAEVEAIEQARSKGFELKDSTLYVTLEPCNHTGHTPPCTKAIIEAGIKKVVVGTPDPNPHVPGGGITFLREHGLEVEVGILEEACRFLIADFSIWQATNRPYIILKSASTLDGKIAARDGESRWITGRQSRTVVHYLRKQVQAVLIGVGAMLADNPRLDSRMAGDDTPTKQPLAIVAAGHHLPDPSSDFYLLKKRAGQVIFWTSATLKNSTRAKKLQEMGCRVWSLPDGAHGLNPGPAFERLRREENCLYVMSEGGGALHASLLQHRLADEIIMFIAPRILADAQAISMVADLGFRTLDQTINCSLMECAPCGNDVFLRLKPDWQ